MALRPSKQRVHSVRRSALLLVASLTFASLYTVNAQSTDLTNADVVRLVSAGVPNDTTIAAIDQARHRQFDVTAAAIAALKQAGVPDSIIAAMRRVSPPPPAPPSAPAQVVGQASSLVGLTADQVRSKIGSPTSIQNRIWYFDSAAGTLRVYFNNGAATEVHPGDFALNALGRGAAPTSVPSALTSPTGGIVCRDGTVSGATNRQGACSGHGGINGSTTRRKKKG
jgi:hypothetical protein